MHRYVVSRNASGHATWWLFSTTDGLVGWAGRTFASLAQAQAAAHHFRASWRRVVYEAHRTGFDCWRWRASIDGETVAVSGGTFSTKLATETGAAAVALRAGRARPPGVPARAELARPRTDERAETSSLPRASPEIRS